jgi:hypothetical protein
MLKSGGRSAASTPNRYPRRKTMIAIVAWIVAVALILTLAGLATDLIKL